jgi:hypothetical protein
MALVCKPFGDIITFTRASTATYFDSAGVLQSAAIDAPRLDYNPSTLAAQGLLIEESRQNLLTYSAEFDNAAWSKSGAATITSNALTSPAGTTTADLLNGSSPADYISQAPSYTSGTAYTHSCFVKAGAGNVVTLRGTAAAFGTEILVDYNLSTGVATVSGGSPSAFGAINTGNGWWRCWFAATASATASGQFQIRPSTASIYLWGAQLEAGAFPTSYIPTTTAALTRAADVASVNTLSPWFNASAGTIYAEYQRFYVGAFYFPRVVSFATGGSNNDLIEFAYSTPNDQFAIVAAGAAQGPVILANGGTALNKIAGAYALNDAAASLNGAAVVTDNTSLVPTVSQMNIGNRQDGLRPFSGYLRRITYYPRRLANADLQTITA